MAEVSRLRILSLGYESHIFSIIEESLRSLSASLKHASSSAAGLLLSKSNLRESACVFSLIKPRTWRASSCKSLGNLRLLNNLSSAFLSPPLMHIALDTMLRIASLWHGSSLPVMFDTRRPIGKRAGINSSTRSLPDNNQQAIYSDALSARCCLH
ncbi:hypothetical protein ANAPC5_01311 [Anaplasma phagocytophilum]|nr:hypothetical protein ANAPC2_01061 [Anaplasma phagocytophilum]SBO33109.1 hypothetical protein ANAPC4_01037 [Anaplasma phagocytophilum]SBO33860.1 hypothetical protein ANAPC3_01387 [Anaplasma phagocytophilum]SCV66060.1 hypothetical protein ANAPC5_01311 [Anaplasma phagocytophilum]